MEGSATSARSRPRAVANGVVFGDTPQAVFALNASTGKTIWVNSGLLSKGADTGVMGNGEGTFEIQPRWLTGKCTSPARTASALAAARPYDWDMQASPIAAQVGGAPAVIGSGKLGIVFAASTTGTMTFRCCCSKTRSR